MSVFFIDQPPCVSPSEDSFVQGMLYIASTLKDFQRPVRIIFGARDPYLNKGVAQKFHELFPASELLLLPNARHFVQMDEPEEVARLLLFTAAT
jgi:pimeloyl-ACP methyl ester carboxylesterase